MKKLLTLLLGLGLFSQQALAVTVLGEEFAGYANSVAGTGGALWVDQGPDGSGNPTYSNATVDINGNITDLDARSWVVGNSLGAYVDLAFNVGVVDGTGNDLKLFLVGNNGHSLDLTIGGITQNFTVAAGVGQTGSFDALYGTDPIIGLGIDLAVFGLSGPMTQLRMTIGDGWCDDTSGPCSAVPSFMGAYNTVASAEVPLPAAVWMFGAGLIGLVGIARRKQL